MRNLKLTIQYDGTRYKGWQRLGNSDMTIQSKIEDVLAKMTNEKIEIIGSGRTDVGVHALGQVANFKTGCTYSTSYILEYLYKYLPEDIVVKTVEEVEERFHARYNIVSKIYLYKVLSSQFHDPFSRRYIEHIPERLDIRDMEMAADYLIGNHDFSSFRSNRSQKKSSIREIYSIKIIKKGHEINLVVQGNGFLHNMVRIIVGTLIEVGLGRMKADDVKNILERKDRKLAGPTAPAKGLYLLEVVY